MPRGGHARSGPAHDPNSARSEQRGVTATAAVLSAKGYQGRLPGLNEFLPQPNARHRRIWTELWRTPQAIVWINERWRYPVVAELTRLMELSERPDCAVGVWAAIRQRRDDLGLSTAGRRLEGWEIVAGVSYTAPTAAQNPADEVGEKREQKQRRSQNLRPNAQ